MGLKKIYKIFIFFLILFYIPLNIKLISETLSSIKDEEIAFSKTKNLEKDQVRIIEMIGIGFQIKEAIQDAAVKALQEVAGSLVDAETFYENKTTIRDGIENDFEIYSEKIRDYSQGSIKSYKVLSSKRIGDQFEAKVRFEIRLEEFETYMKELGYGSKKIKKGLFAKLATETKESDSKVGFFKKVVIPINLAEVYKKLILVIQLL